MASKMALGGDKERGGRRKETKCDTARGKTVALFLVPNKKHKATLEDIRAEEIYARTIDHKHGVA